MTRSQRIKEMTFMGRKLKAMFFNKKDQVTWNEKVETIHYQKWMVPGVDAYTAAEEKFF
jgi:hypothetical protein